MLFFGFESVKGFAHLLKLIFGNRRHIFTESISIPKKTTLMAWSVNFFPFIWKPSLHNRVTTKFNAPRHSWKESASMKKNHLNTPLCMSVPFRFSMRFTACVKRWNIPGAKRKLNFMSSVYTVLLPNCHLRPLTRLLCLDRRTER